MKQQEWQQNPETTMHSSSTVVSQVNLSLLNTKKFIIIPETMSKCKHDGCVETMSLRLSV